MDKSRFALNSQSDVLGVLSIPVLYVDGRLAPQGNKKGTTGRRTGMEKVLNISPFVWPAC